MPESPGDLITAPPVYGDRAVWLPPESRLYPETILEPVGQHAGNITTETAEVDEECRALYLRRAHALWTSAKVRWRPTTAVVGATIGELAIAKGGPVVGAGTTLTVLGWADVTAEIGATGPTSKTIALTGVARGDHLWLLWWQYTKQTGSLAKFRAYLPDNIQSGLHLYATAKQPSTFGSAAFSLQPDNVAGAWSVVQVS